MAHVLVRKDDEPISPSVCEWVIEQESDIAGLPTSTRKGQEGEPTCYPGQTAYLQDLSKVWLLGPDDVWHLAE